MNTKKGPENLERSRGCETKDHTLLSNHLSSELQFKKSRVKIPENSSKQKHLAQSIVGARRLQRAYTLIKCLVEKALVPRLEEGSPALRDSFIFFKGCAFNV